MKIIIGKYQGTIYPEDNGYIGAIHPGTDGKDKLKKAVSELEVGIDTSDSYTVENAVRDWLAKGTRGMSAKTINDYKSLAESNLIPFIGAYKLKELTADNVDDWLDERSEHLTTRTLHRAIRHAQARDKVMRNVADLVDTPKGKKNGRRPAPARPPGPRPPSSPTHSASTTPPPHASTSTPAPPGANTPAETTTLTAPGAAAYPGAWDYPAACPGNGGNGRRSAGKYPRRRGAAFCRWRPGASHSGCPAVDQPDGRGHEEQ